MGILSLTNDARRISIALGTTKEAGWHLPRQAPTLRVAYRLLGTENDIVAFVGFSVLYLGRIRVITSTFTCG